MRLTHISIRNFRTLRSLDLDLQSLVCVTGDNGAGKTNLLRAILWACRNEAGTLESIATHGTSDVRVSITLDSGHTITRHRTKSVNECIVTDAAGREIHNFQKVGQGPIPEVVELTGLRGKVQDTSFDPNLQGVRRSSFLDLSPKEANQLLMGISNAGALQDAAELGRKAAREMAKTLADTERVVGQLRTQKEAFAQADLDTLAQRCNELNRKRDALSISREAVHRVRAAKDALFTFAHSPGAKSKEAYQAAVDALTTARSTLAAQRSMAARNTAVRGATMNLRSLIARKSQVDQERAEVKAAFDELLLALGQCPLCGQKTGAGS